MDFKVIFQNEDEDVKPSELLSLPVENHDIFYEIDRYLHFLNEHKEKAETIISIIKNK